MSAHPGGLDERTGRDPEGGNDLTIRSLEFEGLDVMGLDGLVSQSGGIPLNSLDSRDG